MQLYDISFSTPAENILFDEVLLRLAEEQGAAPVVRFWEAHAPFIVLGRTGKVEDDLKGDEIKAAGLNVLRRASGGGTVVQGKGCLNFAVVLSKAVHPELADIRKSYRFILEKIIQALKLVGVDAVFRPICDLAVVVPEKDSTVAAEKKISGNAQHRGKRHILHHGTILYDFDLSLIEKFLKMPREIPEYRRGRSHLDFLCNIDVPPVAIKAAIKKTFEVDAEHQALNFAQQECLKQFLTNTPQWDLQVDVD